MYCITLTLFYKKNILLVSDAELLSPGMEEWIAGNEQYDITIVETDEKAIELAHQACQGAPGAVVRSKRLLDELAPRPIAEDLRRALAYHLGARNSAEA